MILGNNLFQQGVSNTEQLIATLTFRNRNKKSFFRLSITSVGFNWLSHRRRHRRRCRRRRRRRRRRRVVVASQEVVFDWLKKLDSS